MFGKLHKGRTFQKVLLESPDWVQWFLSHYHTSEKYEHKAFVKFAELHMDHIENVEWELMQDTGQGPTSADASQSVPATAIHSNKAMSKGPIVDKAKVRNPEAALPSESLVKDVSAMQERMLRVEDVLGQILEHVRQSSAPSPSM